MKLVLNPDAEFYQFDGRGVGDANEQWACEVESESGAFRCLMPENVVECLKRFDGSRSVSDAVSGGGLSASEAARLEEHLIRYFLAHGILVDVDRGLAPGSSKAKATRSSYLYYRKRLIAGQTVTRMAEKVRWLLCWPFVLMGSILALAVRGSVYSGSADFAVILTDLQPQAVSTIIVISILGALCHEFGHAAALVRHGGKRPEIGVGIYFLFPVLYTDVSESWRLSRRQRMEVDVSGIYFQLWFTVAFWLAGEMLELPGRSATIIWIDMLIITALNPFLRMDGFWLLSDFVGSHSLRRESVDAVWGIVGRFRAPRQQDRGVGSSRRDRGTTVMVMYFLASVGMFAFVYWRVATLLVTEVFPELDRRIGDIAYAMRNCNFGDGIGGAVIVGWHIVLVIMVVNVTVRGCAAAARVWRGMIW